MAKQVKPESNVPSAAAPSAPSGPGVPTAARSCTPTINVIVMAGKPAVMRSMLDIVAPRLRTGVRMLSETVRANCREGDIGTALGAIARAHPDAMIGSYPFLDDNGKPNTNLVVRARDPVMLAAARRDIEAMLAQLKLV